MREKIVDATELEKICNELKAQNKTVVATSGCFDIIHAGHVLYLDAAKSKGDALVVFLNTDSSVKALKGEKRPIVSQEERAIVMSAFESVDYVCLFSESTPCNLLRLIKPHIFAKGSDYEGKYIEEMDVLKEYGGKIEYISFVSGCSSTNIIGKIKND